MESLLRDLVRNFEVKGRRMFSIECSRDLGYGICVTMIGEDGRKTEKDYFLTWYGYDEEEVYGVIAEDVDEGII